MKVAVEKLESLGCIAVFVSDLRDVVGGIGTKSERLGCLLGCLGIFIMDSF